ncbi:MAG: hypothetical protein HWE21_06385 [Cytophagia bacterium]|nr:hypothetical protein [Cytophagia bacterium]
MEAVALYEQGFGDDDLLNRKRSGERLSELLERVEDPVVVALDGPWGTGKSFFLQRWVGAHTMQNGGAATTVYFDAFAHDYLEDPLIALTGAVGSQLETDRTKGIWENAKRLAFQVARPAFRMAMAVGTAGATEVAGPIMDAAIESGAKSLESAADDFWKREEGRKAAMGEFRACLAALTSPSTEGAGDEKPLVVVVDELDRCRPDYALTILEVIKHFFAVPRVHFVLGTSLDALEKSVRARYGPDVDAASYLKRFITLKMQLADTLDDRGIQRAETEYFVKASRAMGIEQALIDEMKTHLRLAGKSAGITLRDVEKVMTSLVLLPRRKEMGSVLSGWRSLICSMALLKVMKPDFARAAIEGSASLKEVDQFYGFTPSMLGQEDAEDRSEYNHDAFVIRRFWEFALSGGRQPEAERDMVARQFDPFGSIRKTDILAAIERDFFRDFDLVSEA